MLSHLRFHRRGGGAATAAAASNPTSPCPDNINTPTSPPTLQPSSHLQLPSDTSPSSAAALDLRPASSSSSALPPTLPPITRVTSAETDPAHDARRDGDMVSRPDSRSQQQLPRSPYNGDSGFIGGVALRKYQRDVAAQATDSNSRDNSSPGIDNNYQTSNYQTSRPSLTPIQDPVPNRPQGSKTPKIITSSFSTPTDLKNATSGPTGRRPAGTRLASDSQLLAQTNSNPEPQPPKQKKGLPFLKNPMSTLLMRRKTSQHVPDLLPLPLGKRNEEPMYDPRIKGTRVHDFSAPRTKKTLYVPPTTHTGPPPERTLLPRDLTTTNLNASVPDLQHRQPSNASDSLYSTSSQPLQPTLSTTSDNASTIEALSPPTREAPPVPPKDDAPISVQPVPAQVSRLIDEVDTTRSGSMGSIRTGRSRNTSLSGMSVKEIPTAVPRHMKSTSSRFSFDMIGAAEQEKLLEDRHRQRELEKKTADTPVQRDSRFDDFDEDFDYEGMMDDDGFEEPIPMAGDDYDENDYEGNDYEDNVPYEEEIPMVGETTEPDLDDPDNDQENFSGFVFSRSNPTSSLTSPHSTGFLPTPRDADGKVIGFAMSQDNPGMLSPQIHIASLHPDAEVQAAGLGIQGLDISTTLMKQNGDAFQLNQGLPPTDMSRNTKEDDMYFDDGMIGYENKEFAEDLAAPPEWDDTPFDESIFDNHDTDQYGRPIPGAFAQAQQRRATVEEALKRESDMTSRLSAHSASSQSTADTSLSVDHQEPDDQTDQPRAFSQEEVSETSKLPTPNEDTVEAYQAALAAAAHQAVASGKFQRSSSPPLEASPVVDDEYSLHEPVIEDDFRNDGFNDDYGYEDMADFEMDDEDYVAEANACALANDSDGWYGQEFGFYSAPVQQQQQISRDSSSSSLEFEYSNGGFFGPKGGLDRSTSGRMISREPNLTPITERSEYSNRNSIMSMGLPGFSGTPLQSPGLAQLALLGDRGDDMTLSALLRLRSKAWGGSQISLASSREGSPRSERGELNGAPWGPNYFTPMAPPPSGHARKNSVLSNFTADSDGGSISGSPTLTNMGFHAYMAQQPPLPEPEELKLPATDFAPQLQDLETRLSPVSDFNSPTSAIVSPSSAIVSPSSALVSPVSPAASAMVSPLDLKGPDSAPPPAIPPRQRPPMGHRHKNSADSISYIKEEDSGATRWVMERRRTGEYGQVEILEREVVEGGRI